MGQGLPDFFCNKGHEGVQQLEDFRQHIQQHLLRTAVCSLVTAVQAGFCKFNVPVAVVIPDEIVDLAGRNAQFKVIHVFTDFTHHVVQP